MDRPSADELLGEFFNSEIFKRSVPRPTFCLRGIVFDAATMFCFDQLPRFFPGKKSLIRAAKIHSATASNTFLTNKIISIAEKILSVDRK